MKTIVLSVIMLSSIVAVIRNATAVVTKPEDVAWKTATAKFDATTMLPGKSGQGRRTRPQGHQR